MVCNCHHRVRYGNVAGVCVGAKRMRIVRVPRLKRIGGPWWRYDERQPRNKKYLVSTPEEWRKFMGRVLVTEEERNEEANLSEV